LVEEIPADPARLAIEAAGEDRNLFVDVAGVQVPRVGEDA
jgi:hypothetical protein